VILYIWRYARVSSEGHIIAGRPYSTVEHIGVPSHIGMAICVPFHKVWVAILDLGARYAWPIGGTRAS
jgi:hypothetical protein